MNCGREKTMNDSGLNKVERRFEEVVASMAYANQGIRDELSIDTAFTGTSTSIMKLTYKGFYFQTTPLVNQQDNITIGIPEDQDPVTQRDLVNSSENEIQELIYQIRSAPSIPGRAIIANRLLDLSNFSKEEDPDRVGIAVESLRNFYGFLRRNVDLKTPAISLTPDSNIYASWRGDEGRIFSAHFLPSKDVRFVVFRPNDRHPDRKIRISGTTTFDILMDTVTPHRLYDWISE
jgi:hypothetical protein